MRSSLEFFGDSAVISDDEVSIASVDIADLSARLGDQINKGDLVLLECGHSAHGLSVLIGLLEIGAIPLLVPPRYGRELLQQLIDTFSVPVGIFFSDLMNVPFGGTQFSPFADAPFELIRFRIGQPVIDRNLRLLLMTSGSTGSTRLVPQTMQNVDSNTVQITRALGIHSADRALLQLPYHYTYGLSIALTHLAVGARVHIVSRSPLHSDLRGIMTEHQITSLAGVPAYYKMLDRLGFFDEPPPPDLRLATQAGGRLPLDLAERATRHAEAHGYWFATMYGQTEATARMTVMPFDRMRAKLGSVGLPLAGSKVTISKIPDFESELVDVPAGCGVVGEVLFTGPNVCPGYVADADDLACLEQEDQVLATGDLGCIDEDGFLYVVGRLKRISKVAGIRVSLDHLEALIHGAGHDAVVVEADDFIQVFCEEGHSSGVRDTVLTTTTLTRREFRVHEIENFPLLPSGKIDLHALRAIAFDRVGRTHQQSDHQ